MLRRVKNCQFIIVIFIIQITTLWVRYIGLYNAQNMCGDLGNW